ncbi:Gfo/Idh/MocA family protein [Streptomyces sp. CBG33]|uniref:Gfo/Idh/MocA family protein n=1 Tax=Streptomyces sp. CBG33 TaxID=2762624 RepID=UPI001647CE49|nr:Gfo/Idh/MocA family oxidoreductase [Streptomyces sp. CBG33]
MSADNSPTPPARTRVALLGTGPWARSTHAPAIAAHPGAELAGVWGRRAEAAAELAGEYDVPAYSGEDGLGELLAEADAVAIALPPDVQAPLAVRAAGAGCHLLLDKPVATTPAAAREVAAAARAARVASVVFCTLRFAPPTAAWIAEQAGRGGWFTARAQWLAPLFVPGSTHEYASPWRKEKGALWDVGPHALSVLIPVLGDVTAVTAAPGPNGTAHLVLRHASGASSTATLGLGAPPAAGGVEIALYGEHGTAEPPRWGESVTAYGAALDALLEAARTGRPHPCDAAFGARLTEILAEAQTQLG